MNKETKKIIFKGQEYDIAPIEKLLENQAREGWMFKSCSGVAYYFVKSEPKNLTFQVVYLDSSEKYNTTLNADTADSEYSCNDGNWQLIFRERKLNIFCSEEESPVPIIKDEKTKLKNIVKATLSLNFVMWLILPICIMFSVAVNIISKVLYPRSPQEFAKFIASRNQIYLMIFSVLVILYAAMNVLRFLTFYLKNKDIVKKGGSIKYFSERNIKVFSIINRCYLLALTIVLILSISDKTSSVYIAGIVVIAIVIGGVIINKIFNRTVVKKKTKILVTVLGTIFAILLFISSTVFITCYMGKKATKTDAKIYYTYDDIELNLDKLGVEEPSKVKYEERICEKKDTIFGSYSEYSDIYYLFEEKKLGYKVILFSTENKIIANKFKSELKLLEKETKTYNWGKQFIILESNLEKSKNEEIVNFYKEILK